MKLTRWANKYTNIVEYDSYMLIHIHIAWIGTVPYLSQNIFERKVFGFALVDEITLQEKQTRVDKKQVITVTGKMRGG